MSVFVSVSLDVPVVVEVVAPDNSLPVSVRVVRLDDVSCKENERPPEPSVW